MNSLRSCLATVAALFLFAIGMSMFLAGLTFKYQWKRILFLSLVAIPPLFIASMIQHYSVNIFRYDQVFDTVPVMAHWIQGKFTLNDYWPAVNEHRLFFPKLLVAVLGPWTHWDMRSDVWAIWLLALVTLGNIAIIGHRCKCDKWSIVFISPLIFSIIGSENWEFGHQTCFWIPMACYTALPLLAAMPGRYVTTTVACVLANYSICGGLIAWVIAFLMLLIQSDKNKVRNLIWWTVSAACFVALFFGHYHNTGPTTEHRALLEHWSDAIMFFFTFFTIPFFKILVAETSDQWETERLIGIGLFALFCILAWQRRKHLAIWPVFALALVAILTAFLTMIARYGANYQPSRYEPFAALLAVAVLMLIRRRWVMCSIGIAMTVAQVLTIHSSMTYCRDQQVFAKVDKALFQLIWLIPAPHLLNPQTLWLPIPSAKDTLENMRVIDAAGAMNPPALHSRDIGFISDQLYHPECGGWHVGRSQDGHLFMVGTAHFGTNLADIVLITHNGKIIDYALVDTDRRNWLYCADGLAKLGWIPQAWAYDGMNRRAYLLPKK